MKFAHIVANDEQWPIEAQCAASGLSRSGYYAWKRRPEARRLKEDAALVDEIKVAYERGRVAHGSPRVHRELRAHGRRVGKKRIERLMRREGMSALRKRRFRRATDPNHRHPIAPNHLERKLSAVLPNTVWVTDVS